jgi:hypothetical protein
MEKYTGNPLWAIYYQAVPSSVGVSLQHQWEDVLWGLGKYSPKENA